MVEFTLLRHLLISHLPAKARSSRFISLKRNTNREGLAGVVGFLGLAWKSYKQTAPASEHYVELLVSQHLSRLNTNDTGEGSGLKWSFVWYALRRKQKFDTALELQNRGELRGHYKCGRNSLCIIINAENSL